MELLVYARNYRAVGGPADAPRRREAGALVGDGSQIPSTGGIPCSFVEVSLPMSVVDPFTEIDLLVGKAFASWGHPGGGRVLRFGTERGIVSLLLEPGFERARDLCRALHPVLPRARALIERAQPTPAPRRRARRHAVVTNGDHVVRLPLRPSSVERSLRARLR